MLRRTQKLKHNKRFLRKLNRVLAYIYMPVFFSLLAYGIVYIMAYDLISIVKNTVSIIMADEVPDFNEDYESVFVPDSVDIEEKDGVETVKRSDVYIADYGEMYANVKCSKIALDAPVYKGDDDNILIKGIGQNFASSQPGFGRLVLLCGHNNTYFNALKNIVVGDIVEMETSYGTYKYKVTDLKVLEETDTNAYSYDVEKEQLVMYTCYPFDKLSRTQYRYFVYATLVSGPRFVD